jgi:hypothetical protein
VPRQRSELDRRWRGLVRTLRREDVDAVATRGNARDLIDNERL